MLVREGESKLRLQVLPSNASGVSVFHHIAPRVAPTLFWLL
jgi:hypothetical protein